MVLPAPPTASRSALPRGPSKVTLPFVQGVSMVAFLPARCSSIAMSNCAMPSAFVLPILPLTVSTTSPVGGASGAAPAGSAESIRKEKPSTANQRDIIVLQEDQVRLKTQSYAAYVKLSLSRCLVFAGIARKV